MSCPLNCHIFSPRTPWVSGDGHNALTRLLAGQAWSQRLWKSGCEGRRSRGDGGLWGGFGLSGDVAGFSYWGLACFLLCLWLLLALPGGAGSESGLQGPLQVRLQGLVEGMGSCRGAAPRRRRLDEGLLCGEGCGRDGVGGRTRQEQGKGDAPLNNVFPFAPFLYKV